jgi:hypothetical protein
VYQQALAELSRYAFRPGRHPAARRRVEAAAAPAEGNAA